jgi:hypothetical protein
MFIHSLKSIVIIEKSFTRVLLLLLIMFDLRVKWRARARLTPGEIKICKLQCFVRSNIDIWAAESLFFATFGSWLKKWSWLKCFLRTLLQTGIHLFNRGPWRHISEQLVRLLLVIYDSLRCISFSWLLPWRLDDRGRLYCWLIIKLESTEALEQLFMSLLFVQWVVALFWGLVRLLNVFGILPGNRIEVILFACLVTFESMLWRVMTIASLVRSTKKHVWLSSRHPYSCCFLLLRGKIQIWVNWWH